MYLNESNLTDESRKEFHQKLTDNYKAVDRSFGWLLLLEWAGAILIALVCSPLAWDGASSATHSHVWQAILLGGMLAVVPFYLSRHFPGYRCTRLVIASAQVLFSSLLIHLSAGRIETHFHVFVSIALLVAYRDTSVFIPAVLITAVDHIFRGIWWPQSVFGKSVFEVFQPLEHAIWLLLETVGLCFVVQENLRQWLKNAILQDQLKAERVQLELRVEERTKQLSNLKQFREEILDSIDASVCILDMHGRIVFVNEKWADLVNEYGDSENCTLGSTYLEDCVLAKLGSPEFVRQVADKIGLISVGECDSFCSEFADVLNKEVRHFQLNITPIALDGELGVAVVHVDVTHLKRAEIRASALANLVLESPDEVMIASVDSSRFIEVNEGAARNTGFSRAEMLKLGLFDLFDGLQADVVQSKLFRIGSGCEDVARFESIIRRRDGTEYPCSVSLHRTQFEEQDVWVQFISDLSEQKNLELKLQQAQKLESLGTLAAGIAHEINTPMQCVVGNFEFLQNSFGKLTALSDRLVELLDASSVDWSAEREQLQSLRKEYKYDFLRKQTPMALEEAADSSRRIVSIVRAMKAMSHPGTEDAVETNLHEVIENAVIISRNRWKFVAELQQNFAPDLPKIYGFPAELSQVFINLFVNSTDAIIERLGPDPAVLGLIAVDTRLANDHVIVRVRDTGNGIPPNILKKIFDPFFTTKEVGKGTGQGLAITHAAIVGKHKGRISVTSEVGIGTVFTIELPITANAPEEKSPASNLSNINLLSKSQPISTSVIDPVNSSSPYTSTT